VEKIVPGAKVQVVGQHGGRATTVTASRVALCPGPWAKTLIEPLLGKISILKNQNFSLYIFLNEKITELPLKTVRVPVYYWKVKEQGRGAMNAILIDYGPGKAWSLPELEYKGLVKVRALKIFNF
jgi:hypothetical protein